MSRTLENNHIEFRNKIFSCFAVIAVFGRGGCFKLHTVYPVSSIMSVMSNVLPRQYDVRRTCLKFRFRSCHL